MTGTPKASGLCVILCPPWPRSGSANLFWAQTKSYLAMGFEVAVVAVSHHGYHGADSSDFWADVTRDFAFDSRQALFINRSHGRTRRFLSASYWTWRFHGRDSALAIEARLATGSDFDPEFMTLIDHRGVAVIHVNHCMNMGVARNIAARMRDSGRATPTIILDTHDIQADRYRDCAVVSPFNGRIDGQDRLARDEMAVSRQADALLHLTMRDMAHFREMLPEKRHFLLRPTTRNEMSPVSPPGGAKRVDFIYVAGGHEANVRSIRWFLEHVAPALDLENLSVRITGGINGYFRDLYPDLYAAHRDFWTHDWPDIRGVYMASRFVLAPTQGGTGISIKLVEALAMGKFVVTTSAALAGFEGIEGMHDAVSVADTPADFAAAMTDLASRDATVNEAGRAIYLRDFSNTTYMAALSEVVGRVVNR